MNVATALPTANLHLMPKSDVFWPLVKSFLFHAVVIVIAVYGMPYIKPEIEIDSQPVTIEIMDIDEFTQSNKPKNPKADARKKKKTLDDKVTANREIAPKVTAAAPPRPVRPEAPDETDDPVSAKTETAYIPKIPLPNVKPYKPKPKKAPKPQLRPDINAKSVVEQEQFKSVLRNLMPDAPDQKIEKGEESYTKPDKPRLMSRFADRLTMSEQEMLRRKLSQCWKLMAGARYAEDLIVELKLFMNRDGTVRQASVMNASRYNHDSFYRAAADSALRAVTNPTCSPFGLPAEKYEAWKVIVVRFDPREVL